MGTLAGSLIKNIKEGKLDEKLVFLYVDKTELDFQKKRYINALEEFIQRFGDREIEVFSAPGRCEIGGNHTDHQLGKVLTASVNLDVIAVVAPNDKNIINFYSEGYGQVEVDIQNLNVVPGERETTASLIRGVAAGVKKRGFEIGGFDAYVTSRVLSGSGLSSSAAIEILISTIFSGLFNGDGIDPVVQAKIGQEAENIYFGKPSGLLDQMGCSVGGLVFIDFADINEPLVKRIDVDFKTFSHSLCVVDTKASHANLTDEYAAIPGELSKLCGFFGKRVLREVSQEEFYEKLPQVRKYAGDRAVLRAIHVFDDNKRVEEECQALIEGDFNRFKRLVFETGNSSYQYLQNIYSVKSTENQEVAIALAMTKKILGEDCACRNQGGGFAGTIEVFVENERVSLYKKEIEKIFGEGSCHVLQIRNQGGVRL